MVLVVLMLALELITQLLETVVTLPLIVHHVVVVEEEHILEMVKMEALVAVEAGRLTTAQDMLAVAVLAEKVILVLEPILVEILNGLLVVLAVAVKVVLQPVMLAVVDNLGMEQLTLKVELLVNTMLVLTAQVKAVDLDIDNTTVVGLEVTAL